MIKRCHKIEKLVQKGKVLVIYGPRQVGKTTLLRQYLDGLEKKYLSAVGDDIFIREILSSQSFDKILDFIGDNEVFALDEAQLIPEIGRGLKIIVDQKQDIVVIATGSSSFELARQTGEPLTGRKKTVTLYPIAQLELLDKYSKFELRQKLEEFLVFGSYPEVLNSSTKRAKEAVLKELVSSYLFRDILALEKIKSPQLLIDLLRLLAFQIGSRVSLTELAGNLKINWRTVARYLDILEKGFVIYRLGGYSGNLRKEIGKQYKYYFFDNGIRNALIGQLNPIEVRSDIGQLWENFLFMERLKFREYKNRSANIYFWRGENQKEIDLIEERGGLLYGYEFKWSQTKKTVAPKDFRENYPNSSFKAVTPKNYLDFVVGL